ncbi:MAG: type II secretion system protein [Parachlamydiaceae bacterium]
MKLYCVYRRYMMLLEVLIAFVLVVLCALPLIYPHALILRSEKQFTAIVELDHFVNLLYTDILQKMYQNEIPWSSIQSKKNLPINDAMLSSLGYENKLPFNGTYRFEDKKHKISSDQDHAAYWLKLIITFTPKKGAFIHNLSPKQPLKSEIQPNEPEELSYTYEYDVIVEQRAA